jgi:AcrR family transcriptional regulator
MRSIQRIALELFEARGYDHTTISDVAAAVQLSPRTVFRYFPTKEDLVFWSTYSPRLPSLLAEQPRTLPPAIALRQALVTGLGATFGEDEERILRWARIGFRTASLRPRMAMQQATLTELFVDLLSKRASVHDSELRRRVIAAALSSALFVALDIWQTADARLNLPELVDEALAEAASAFDA